MTDIILAEPGVISVEADPVPAPWPCRAPGADPERWFPVRGDAVGARRAKRLCQPCPVRLECLASALVRNEQHGVFGGMTVTERRALKRRIDADATAVRLAVETAVQPDGSAVLDPADLLTVLGALADAVAFRQEHAGSCCLYCVTSDAGPCEYHRDDQDQAAAYRAAAERLGDYR